MIKAHYHSLKKNPSWEVLYSLNNAIFESNFEKCKKWSSHNEYNNNEITKNSVAWKHSHVVAVVVAANMRRIYLMIIFTSISHEQSILNAHYLILLLSFPWEEDLLIFHGQQMNSYDSSSSLLSVYCTGSMNGAKNQSGFLNMIID